MFMLKYSVVCIQSHVQIHAVSIIQTLCEKQSIWREDVLRAVVCGESSTEREREKEIERERINSV